TSILDVALRINVTVSGQHLGWSQQIMVDGRTDAIGFADSLGRYQTSAPVAVDLTGDGRDEVILPVNYQVITALHQKRFFTMLVAIDFSTGSVVQFGDPLDGSNLADRKSGGKGEGERV